MSWLRKNDLDLEYEIQLREIVKEATLDTLYTPDMWRLFRFPWQHLFVYGEMQDKFPRFSVIDQGRQPWHYRAFTETSYSVFKKKLGIATQAIALPEAYVGAPLCNVGGQVHVVRPHVLKEIDKLYMNGIMYHRELVSVIIPYRKQVEIEGRVRNYEECVHQQKVWMYIGNAEYWNFHLDGGYLFSPVARMTSKIRWCPEYYYFSKLEYVNNN